MSKIERVEVHEYAQEVENLVAPGVRYPVPPVFGGDYNDQLEAVGKDGCYPVPSEPGLGVPTNWDFVNRNRTMLHTFE